MRRLLFLLLLATVTFAQSTGLTVWVPIPNRTFELGYGASYSQDLGVTPAQLQIINGPGSTAVDGVYIISFSIENHFQPYPGKWEMELTFGTQKLCDWYGWGLRNFTQVPFTCPGPGYLVDGNSLPGGGPAQGKNNFILTTTVNDGSANGGWPIKFNDVTLRFIPTN